jgi:hypothetical protein
MTNAIKVLLQMQSGFLQLESTLDKESLLYLWKVFFIYAYCCKFTHFPNF